MGIQWATDESDAKGRALFDTLEDGHMTDGMSTEPALGIARPQSHEVGEAPFYPTFQ